MKLYKKLTTLYTKVNFGGARTLFFGTIALIGAFGASLALATTLWPNTATPPQGGSTVSAPLNAGSGSQTKNAVLSLEGLYSYGSQIVENGIFVGMPSVANDIQAGIVATYLRGTGERDLCVSPEGKVQACSGPIVGGGAGAPTVNLTISFAPGAQGAWGPKGPVTITSGTDVELSWSTTNAVACFSDWSGNTSTAGSNTQYPTANKTYGISCFSASGQKTTDSVVVNVFTTTKSVTLSASKTTMMNADTTNLTWTTSGNPTSCIGTVNRNVYFVTSGQKQWNGNGFSKNTGGGTEILDLYAGAPWWNTEFNELDYVFTVECQFSSGGPLSDTVTVKVLNPNLLFDASSYFTFLPDRTSTSSDTRFNGITSDPYFTTNSTFKFEKFTTYTVPDESRGSIVSVPYTFATTGGACPPSLSATLYYYVYITKTNPGVGTQSGYNKVKQDISFTRGNSQCVNNTFGSTFTKVAP